MRSLAPVALVAFASGHHGHAIAPSSIITPSPLELEVERHTIERYEFALFLHVLLGDL